MRSMPGTRGDVMDQRRQIHDRAIGHRAGIGIDVLAQQRDLADALRASARTSASTESNGRLTSSPRVYGTTQKLQYLLQPSMIETKARAPSARGGGSWSNFSISGKLTSTTRGRAPRARRSSRGSRCMVCGPNTRSTNGARALIASPSWLATQPPTPMISSGRALLERAPFAQQREHLVLRLLAHRAGVHQQHVGLGRIRRSAVRPARSRSTSAMRAESYSFIWQPKVLM